jgi:hypothetical protein
MSRRAFEAAKIVVPCQAGDVLLIDNVLTAHAVELASCSQPVLSVVREYLDGAGAPGPDPIG